MALNQLPVIQASVVVSHTGPADGASFSAILSASDGAPVAPQQVFTFDLTVFAPDLVADPTLSPLVGVFREPGGQQVEVDTTVEPDLITVAFHEPVDPASYRIKVVG